MAPPSEIQKLRSTLEDIQEKVAASQTTFDKAKHDSESRLEITKLFLRSYFSLVAWAFAFAAIYNFVSAIINSRKPEGMEALGYLDVSNTVSIITTTLSSGVGFVIGYYFKTKGDG